MSGWELFTWFNVGVLAIGSTAVFVLFLRQVRGLLDPRQGRSGDRESSTEYSSSPPE